jgi:hypothetical protein
MPKIKTRKQAKILDFGKQENFSNQRDSEKDRQEINMTPWFRMSLPSSCHLLVTICMCTDGTEWKNF